MIDYFPAKKFMVTCNPAEIIITGVVSSKMTPRIDTIRWEIKSQAIEKNSLMILDLLATNNWKRPVYFVMTTSPETYIGLEPWFHLEGLAYRLLPVKARPAEGQTGEVNTDVMYDNLMNRFKWGNMTNRGLYLDDNNKRMVMNMRTLFGRLSDALIMEGKKDSARRVMDRCIEVMPDAVAKYDFFSVPMVEGYYKIGDPVKANEIAAKLIKYSTDELAWLFSFPDNDLKPMEYSIQEALYSVQRLSVMTSEAKQLKLAAETEASFKKYSALYFEKVYQR